MNILLVGDFTGDANPRQARNCSKHLNLILFEWMIKSYFKTSELLDKIYNH